MDERSSSTGDAGGAVTESAALRAQLNRGPAVGTQLEDREIVYTGSMTLRVDDAEAATEDVRKVAEDAGGFVSAQDAQLQGEQEIATTVRVPADRFADVAAEVAELGVVEARRVDSEDVTDQVVDLEGRLENARASAERLRELLDGAQNLDNIVTIEERLAQRESDIEQIEGQLEVVRDRVQLATLELILTERAAPTVNDELPGPVESLRAGAVAVANIGLVALAAAAFLVPFSPFILAGWWLVRRRRRRRVAAQTDQLPPPPQSPLGSPSVEP